MMKKTEYKNIKYYSAYYKFSTDNLLKMLVHKL